MARKIAFMLFSLLVIFSSSAVAKGADPIDSLISLNQQMIQSAKDGNLQSVEKTFSQFKTVWKKEEPAIKKENISSYSKMNSNIAMISLSLINKDTKKVQAALSELGSHLETYRQAVTLKDAAGGSSRLTLSAYIQSLKETKQLIKSSQTAEAQVKIDQLVTNWLAVEGDVVSQSKAAYTTSEENLALMKAEAENRPDQAIKHIDEMIQLLEPIASSSYSWLDAALIPVREGMEALLVIGALLTMTKKARVTRSSVWT